jgi:hypothetical protein
VSPALEDLAATNSDTLPRRDSLPFASLVVNGPAFTYMVRTHRLLFTPGVVVGGVGIGVALAPLTNDGLASPSSAVRSYPCVGISLHDQPSAFDRPARPTTLPRAVDRRSQLRRPATDLRSWGKREHSLVRLAAEPAVSVGGYTNLRAGP